MQRFFRAFVNQAGQVFAQRVAGFAQRLAHGGVFAPGIQHADRLGSLPGKNEGESSHDVYFLCNIEMCERPVRGLQARFSAVSARLLRNALDFSGPACKLPVKGQNPGAGLGCKGQIARKSW